VVAAAETVVIAVVVAAETVAAAAIAVAVTKPNSPLSRKRSSPLGRFFVPSKTCHPELVEGPLISM
jgi:hypothetical protein